MGDGVNDFLTNNGNLAKQLSTQIASIGLEKAGANVGTRAAGEFAGKVAGKVGGAIVDPAVWIVTGQRPDAVDLGLYGMGLAGGIIALAAAGTGIMKAMVDDVIDQQLAQAASCEPERYRKFIKAAARYGSAGHFTNAMSVAGAGGTAWLHPNGLWVYLTDANGKLVCDYKPAVATKIFQPILPLRPTGNGVRWHQTQG